MLKRFSFIGGFALTLLIVAFSLRPGQKTPAKAPVLGDASAPAVEITIEQLPQNLEEIVSRYRKTIVLLEDDASLSDTDRERASLVGKIIFQENHLALELLSRELTSEIAQAGDFAKAPEKTTRFLDLIETQQELHDADKLSFREVLADIAESLVETKVTAVLKTQLEARVDEDRKALAEIQSLYEKELDKIFGRFETRGMPVRREAWERYVAYIRTRHKRDEILKNYESVATRIKDVDKQAKLHKDNDLEIYGTALPPKTLVLTFDDGPHARYTDRILEVLKKNGIGSVFFQVGNNVGTLKENRIEPRKAAAATRRLVDAGFTIGSHSFTHTQLPGMSDKEVAVEIEQTNRILQSVTNIAPVLFRPPYGDKDQKVMAALEAHKMKSILWNIDSRDWADPVAKSIANRVISEARKLNRGIVLMHDIHERTIEALPLIIDTLRKDGYRFLSWDGQTFVETAPQITGEPPAVPEPAPAIYRESWAVVVGIDNYAKWPKLHYAVNDANGIKEILTRKYSFKADHVFTLLNEDATRERILSVLGDTLSNPKTVHRDDRVFVFFAGHGATRKLPSGRDLGYIVPFDADLENFQGQSISMTNFQDISESIPAKHVFFVMDSCYSGLALTRGQLTGNYIREVSKRMARQMLTAGGANEQVADNGPNGHSIFTWTVLQGLEGRADLNSDGFISGGELSSYVAPSVSGLSKQTPAFGNLPGNEGGEFMFELHPELEFLSDLSTQLDREAIQLNAELERIRKDVAAKTARNQQLKDQVAAAQALAQPGAPGPLAATPAKTKRTFSSYLNQGNSYFKEKKYPQALNEYLAAAKLDPKSPVAVNNVGYVYHKMDKLEDAVKWLEKTIELAPRRAPAYSNLGDVYFQLNRIDEARRTYEKYLELDPNAKYASIVRQRMATPAPNR
jgi:peptidoglycan/xylan/chitin deacetylase (PgdA/CDA1 family)/uncharacterized caspase-like protein